MNLLIFLQNYNFTSNPACNEQLKLNDNSLKSKIFSNSRLNQINNWIYSNDETNKKEKNAPDNSKKDEEINKNNFDDWKDYYGESGESDIHSKTTERNSDDYLEELKQIENLEKDLKAEDNSRDKVLETLGDEIRTNIEKFRSEINDCCLKNLSKLLPPEIFKNEIFKDFEHNLLHNSVINEETNENAAGTDEFRQYTHDEIQDMFIALNNDLKNNKYERIPEEEKLYRLDEFECLEEPDYTFDFMKSKEIIEFINMLDSSPYFLTSRSEKNSRSNTNKNKEKNSTTFGHQDYRLEKDPSLRNTYNHNNNNTVMNDAQSNNSSSNHDINRTRNDTLGDEVKNNSFLNNSPNSFCDNKSFHKLNSIARSMDSSISRDSQNVSSNVSCNNMSNYNHNPTSHSSNNMGVMNDPDLKNASVIQLFSGDNLYPMTYPIEGHNLQDQRQNIPFMYVRYLPQYFHNGYINPIQSCQTSQYLESDDLDKPVSNMQRHNNNNERDGRSNNRSESRNRYRSKSTGRSLRSDFNEGGNNSKFEESMGFKSNRNLSRRSTDINKSQENNNRGTDYREND